MICWVWMEMLMQLWRPEFELDGINLGSWYHCLPIGIYHWLGEGGYIAVVCKVVCYTEVRPGLSGRTRRPASVDRTACRQFQATGQPVSRTQASDAVTSRLPRYEAKYVQCRCFQCGSVPLCSDIKGTELPPANILIPLERQLIALQLCHWQSFFIQCVHEKNGPPKYNGVVFEILDRHHWNFYNRI